MYPRPCDMSGRVKCNMTVCWCATTQCQQIRRPDRNAFDVERQCQLPRNPDTHDLYEHFLIRTSLGCSGGSFARLGSASGVNDGSSNPPSMRSIPTHFRFRDLAPEMRNRIYDCVFEDDAPHHLSIFNAREAAPPSAITDVSRQIRNETLGLYKRAIASFKRSHDFYVPFDVRVHDYNERLAILMRFMEDSKLELSRFEFVFTGLKGWTRTSALLHDFRALAMVQDDGKVVWSWWWSPECEAFNLTIDPSLPGYGAKAQEWEIVDFAVDPSIPTSEATARECTVLNTIAQSRFPLLPLVSRAPIASLNVSNCALVVGEFLNYYVRTQAEEEDVSAHLIMAYWIR